MIAVDTNVLVHAHRRDAAFHDRARTAVADLAEGTGAWAVPWACIHEFLAIVTHPRIFSPPTPLSTALEQVEIWSEAPTVTRLSEAADHWERLAALLVTAKVDGPRVHDARVAAVCLSHGVQTLWTFDRDFTRFPALRTHNPLS